MADVGIHVPGDLDRLAVTVASVRRWAPGARLCLLLEPGAPEACRRMAPEAELIRPVRAGGATAFNALLETSQAPAVAFLECGAQITRGALERLERALAGTVVMAGPSTNLAWNEQRQSDAPPLLADAEGLEGYARALGERQGDGVRDLLPLHSLADFCLVARREPLIALGGADDAYDPGPCWEMDLNVRAQRMGWRGVWVTGVYVHRAPATAARRARETDFFLENKRRFQDRFCGRLLAGTKSDHSAHCLGDACPDFAPPAAIRVLIRGRASTPALPLVTCMLAGWGEPGFAAEAIRVFLGQDYPHRELLVIDEAPEPIAPLVPMDGRIRVLRPPGGSLEEGRRLAWQHARGEIIAHLDGSCWYPSHRLTTQVRALLDGGAQVSGSSTLWRWDPSSDRAWLGRTDALAGSTVVYRRSVPSEGLFRSWQAGRSLPPTAGAVDLQDPELCVAIGGDPDPGDRETDPLVIEARLGSRMEAYRDAASGRRPALPLVSCIMPTCGRPEFVALAIDKFQAQDYGPRELIVLDDGPLPVAALAADRPNVRYFRLDGRPITIGEKRNIACRLAAGEVICTWDDDDWYAPERLRCQVLPIAYDEADLTALRCDHFLCLPSGQVWTVNDDVHRQMFESDVAGGTVTFHRRILQGIRFPHIRLAEDAALIRMARARGWRLKAITDHQMFAYVRHPRNTWRFEPGSFHDPSAWRPTEMPPAFSPAMLAAHQDACRVWLQRRC